MRTRKACLRCLRRNLDREAARLTHFHCYWSHEIAVQPINRQLKRTRLRFVMPFYELTGVRLSEDCGSGTLVKEHVRRTRGVNSDTWKPAPIYTCLLSM